MRESTVFYRSFYEAIKELDADMQSQVYCAIFEYALNFNQLELTGVAKTVFTLIKPQLDANQKRYDNGNKPKLKQTISKTEASHKQDTSKQYPNANVNDNVNVNAIKKKESDKSLMLENRKKDFMNSLIPFLDEFSKETVRAFYDYWTEHSENGFKMRFEMQKVFDKHKRLTTWKGREKNFFKGGVVEKKDKVAEIMESMQEQLIKRGLA